MGGFWGRSSSHKKAFQLSFLTHFQDRQCNALSMENIKLNTCLLNTSTFSCISLGKKTLPSVKYTALKTYIFILFPINSLGSFSKKKNKNKKRKKEKRSINQPLFSSTEDRLFPSTLFRFINIHIVFCKHKELPSLW